MRCGYQWESPYDDDQCGGQHECILQETCDGFHECACGDQCEDEV